LTIRSIARNRQPDEDKQDEKHARAPLRGAGVRTNPFGTSSASRSWGPPKTTPGRPQGPATRRFPAGSDPFGGSDATEKPACCDQSEILNPFGWGPDFGEAREGQPGDDHHEGFDPGSE